MILKMKLQIVYLLFIIIFEGGEGVVVLAKYLIVTIFQYFQVTPFLDCKDF